MDGADLNTRPIEWRVSDEPVAYPDALAFMEARVAEIAAGSAPELIWLLDHPPLYTAGTSAKPADLVDPNRFAVYDAGRGGQYTYHGPGQRVVYVMLDVKKRTGDVRAFVTALENWVIAAAGTVRPRGEGLENPKLATGQIEVVVKRFEILNMAKTPPFELDNASRTNEETRLMYRYLDLRRPAGPRRGSNGRSGRTCRRRPPPGSARTTAATAAVLRW